MAGCTVSGSDWMPDPATCPEDVAAHMQREQACYHLAGEITGNPASGRDAEVQQTLEKLQCGPPLHCARKALLKKYAAQLPVYDTTTRMLRAIYESDYTNEMQLSESVTCLKY